MKTANIYHDIIYNENKPEITVLFETNFTKEIRIVMQQGTQMKEHKTKFPIVIQVLEGHIDFGVSGKLHQLIKGNIIALDGNVPHNLNANENSVIRLTLTKYDDTKRVKNIIE